MSPSLAPLLLLDVLARSRSNSTASNPAIVVLALALAAAGNGQVPGGNDTKHTKKARRLKGILLRQWVSEVYLPAYRHRPLGATASLIGDCLTKLEASLGRPATLFDCRVTSVDRFRQWLAGEAQGGRIRPATANKHLRHLRAVVNFAAKKRLAKRLPAIEFLEENLSEVTAWTPEEVRRLKEQARQLSGTVAGVPAAIWWSAWLEVLSSIGSRITATMLARRADYSKGTLLLRRENQKQKKDQRLALPPRAAVAVERLLASHQDDRIFPWPHDPGWPGRPRKWKCLMAHFQRLLVAPAGLALPKGVKSRQFRRTVATLVDERQGDAQKLLGHSSPRITERYKDRRRMPVCREALRLAESAETQLELF